MTRRSQQYRLYLDKCDETPETIKVQCKICLSKES